MDTSISYKCPSCGGTITWNSKKQKMVCEYCDTEFTEEQIEVIEEESTAENTQSQMEWGDYDTQAEGRKLEHMKIHICQSCGGEIVGDENSVATQCVYCGSPTILTENIDGVYCPDYVIPFKLDKKAAKEALKGFYKGKRLLPSLFAAQNRIEKITGVYAPFWLFDCDADARITYDATRVRFYSDSQYNYTETRHYAIVREGKIGFERIPADGSSKLDDAYMDSLEPFHYGDLTEFSPNYLSGYFADKYDVSSKENEPRVNQRVKNSTEEAFRRSVKGYEMVTPRNSNVNIKNGRVSYVMMPVWMLSTKYKDKVYTFAMNGQTGKMVGELPVDTGKAWKYMFGISAIAFAIGQLAVWLI
ncbi:MAG: hypothetical protein PHN80_13920 [Hespellia sp.]|nr:hypothetical protein [Hespellia sp.]